VLESRIVQLSNGILVDIGNMEQTFLLEEICMISKKLEYLKIRSQNRLEWGK